MPVNNLVLGSFIPDCQTHVLSYSGPYRNRIQQSVLGIVSKSYRVIVRVTVDNFLSVYRSSVPPVLFYHYAITKIGDKHIKHPG